MRQTYSFLVNIDPNLYDSVDAAYIPKLAPRLAQQYDETDPGILVALITMNYLVLQPGESIYIPADGIHAYLSGDIIECMARSNNVLNTGFCPAAERSNVDLFCKCLTFKPHSAQESMLKPQKYDGGKQGKTKLFAPPMSEFSMLEVSIEGSGKEELAAVDGPGVLIVSKGGAKMTAGGRSFELNEGSVYFIAKGVELGFDSGRRGLLAHIAFVE